MEINKSKTEKRKVINPEGSLVLERLPEIQLYLEGSNLNVKGDLFYQTAEDKLKSFIDLAKSIDNEYLYGLSLFLSDNGLKLSPVVLSVVLSNKGYSFRDNYLYKIFNTPQRIAEALSLGLHLNNSFKKNCLKKALENMSDFTLRKNKLLRKKIKLKDEIKLLRPAPKDTNTSDLYKAIIEDNELSKMKETESFVRVKSSKNMSDNEKIKYLVENVEKIPLNELIRNLKFIVDKTDFETNMDLQKRIHTRLNSINDFKFLNIFDLITTAIYVPQLQSLLFSVIKRFVDKIKEKFNYVEKEATVLFDVSGSMNGKGLENGFKYLVLFTLMFDNLKLRLFGYTLWEDKYQHRIDLIRKGYLKEAYDEFNCLGGTALLQSIKELLNEHNEVKNLIVISDEVSWSEGSDLSCYIDNVNKLLSDVKLTLINPVVYAGTVFKKNTLAFASLTSAILYNVIMHTNPIAFVKYIKEYGK